MFRLYGRVKVIVHIFHFQAHCTNCFTLYTVFPYMFAHFIKSLHIFPIVIATCKEISHGSKVNLQTETSVMLKMLLLFLTQLHASSSVLCLFLLVTIIKPLYSRHFTKNPVLHLNTQANLKLSTF